MMNHTGNVLGQRFYVLFFVTSGKPAHRVGMPTTGGGG